MMIEAPKTSETLMFDLSVPKLNGGQTDFLVSLGEIAFVLGANGTGKSNLMHNFYSRYQTKAKRISAHRQTWFNSGSVTLSPQQKKQSESMIQQNDINPNARWSDNQSEKRSSIAIYNLIDAENVRARSIAAAVDRDLIDLARKLSQKDSPLKIINSLFRLSGMPNKRPRRKRTGY